MLKRADYNVDTLEDRVTLDYQSVITGIDQIKDSVKGLKSQLDKIGKNTGIPKLNNQIKQSSGFSKTLKGIAGIGTAVVTGRKMIKTLQGMTDESVNFVETANLFSVSMGKGLQGLNQYYERAVKFQNELEEKLGVNIEESMNYQALFNSMSKSMGISAKYAYILSENFTKLGYDLSSLYNIDPENAMQKLRAGLAGQTKPLRDLGLDITQQSLQPIADSLGIERSVKNMSQAEKMVLRYIAVLKQAQIAQGDFANTMESPANQLRIFNAQVVAFKRNMGNLWQGLLGGVLPYVNAIMMVINELLKMIAKLFGFKVSDQKVNLSANIGADDLASDLGTASGKAKELKNQLMGFDEINNITLPSSSGGGSGGISGGGIDQRLLDAMKEYDNLMGKVKNKATDIRDKIMKWLGFTKKINPLTGEISWEYTGMSKQAKTILGILKTICALYIGAKILKLIGWLNTLRKVLLGTQKATTSFQAGLALLGKGFRGVVTAGKTLTTNFKYYKALGATTGQAFSEAGKDMLNLIPTTVKVAGGIAGLVGSCGLAYKSMKDLSEKSTSTGEALLKLSGGIAGATASGAILGSVIPGVGTAVGAMAGALVGAIAGLTGYNSAMDETQTQLKKAREEWTKQNEEIKKTAEEWDNMVDSVQGTLNGNLAEIENTQRLSNELENLIDVNGKVKEGYEARVEYILNNLNKALGTEYELTDNQITKNGEIIGSYEDIKKEIYNLIEAKKAQAVYDANMSIYTEALKKQQGYYNNLETSQKNYNKALEDTQGFLDYYKNENNGYGWIKKQLEDCNVTTDDIINNTDKWRGALGLIAVDNGKLASQLKKEAEEHRNAIKQNEEAYNNASRIYKQANDFIIAQDNLGTAILTGNKEEINKALETLTSTYETETGTQTATFSQRINNQIAYSNQLKEKLIENNVKITEDTQKQLNAGIKAVADNLRQQSSTVENLTPDVVEAWKALGENNYEIYQEKLSQLSPEVQKEVQKMTGVIVQETSNAVPKVEKASTSISDAITKNLDGTFSINFGLNADYSGLKKKLTNMRSMIDRMAGVPVVGNSFKGIQTNLNKLISQLSINGYESGGFPVSGEMFLARENGLPEMVGKIGNKTSVANNGQIIEGIKAGVYEAVMTANAQNGGTRVSLDVKADEGIIVKKASKGFTEYVEQTGELPFPVPV